MVCYRFETQIAQLLTVSREKEIASGEVDRRAWRRKQKYGSFLSLAPSLLLGLICILVDLLQISALHWQTCRLMHVCQPLLRLGAELATGRRTLRLASPSFE